jgi:murein DD-endopeptidase MepM/ murein hydrolase activator NlpD
MKELGLPMPAVSIQPNSENDTNKHLVDENDVSPHYRKMYEDSYENSYEYSASKTFINRIRPSVLLELDFGLPVDGRVTVTTDYGFDSLTISGKTIQRWHGGVDLASSTPTSIIAAHSGYVEGVAADTIYGNNLYIRYARKFPKDTDVPFFAIKTRYSHLSSIRVRNDDWVEKGQVVGIMGSTGMSTGVHLDFRIYIDGKVVNPNKFYSLPFYEGQIK